VTGPESLIPWLSGLPAGIDSAVVVRQMLRRAASRGFETWWNRAAGSGFCASPIRLAGNDEFGRQHHILTRCNNRRATACPSCSDLYARDIWQLIHAGLNGGHHGIPPTVADHPQLFVTLTAPSFGRVHGIRSGVCHTSGPGRRECAHGQLLGCESIHDLNDPAVGQPLCSECYDYISHVLFAWHAPELWRRFTIRLRRSLSRELSYRGSDPKGTKPSFVKVVELQRRGVPHFHSVIRLDAASPPGEEPSPPDSNLEMADFAELVRRAAIQTKLLTANDTVLRFGEQLDIKSIGQAHKSYPDDSVVTNGRVAAYLAKYVTKSVTDLGINVRRLSPEGIELLDVTDHVRRILQTIEAVARGEPYAEMALWLHTLGYRGHVTSKSRQFSTTMKAIRDHRADWRRQQADSVSGGAALPLLPWEFERSGYDNLGDRVLVVSASARVREARLIGRSALSEGA
jgi:hypothetical protein